MNNAGEATGFFFNTSGGYATFFRDGQSMTDIGSLGGDAAFPRRIGPDGSIVGFSDLSIIQQNGIPLQHAFLYRDGVMTDLGTLGGPFSDAQAINHAGQIVGWSWAASSSNRRAVLWANGVITDLGDLGSGVAEAVDINNAGQIIGVSYV